MLPPQAKGWGLYGYTSHRKGDDFAEEAWKIAFDHVTTLMKWGDGKTRDFLESVDGWRLGYAVLDALDANEDWVKAITHAPDLEQNCITHFQEFFPQEYKVWSQKNPSQRAITYSEVSTEDLNKAVNYLLATHYSQEGIDKLLEEAGPIGEAFILLIRSLPPEIQNEYINSAILPDETSEGMSPS